MEDTELVQQLKNGDKAAFDRIYEKYGSLCYRSALLILGSREDAEDVLQDTFVTCYQKIGELRKEESLKWWLLSITTRYARKKGRRISLERPDENIEETMNSSGFEHDFSESIAAGSDIMEVLGMLDRKHREVIILYYYDELPVREIAKLLNCFEGTVKSRLNKARLLMKKGLTHDAFIYSKEVTCHE